MLQAIYKRQIIQAGAFAAGGREARAWRKAGDQSALRDGDKTFRAWKVLHGEIKFLTFLQLAFTQTISLSTI